MAGAQSTGSNSSNSTSVSNIKNTKSKKSKKASEKLDNRKNYEWKDGQQATPTGHEATGIGGSSAQPEKRDTTGTSAAATTERRK
jgi:hypothetical protein